MSESSPNDHRCVFAPSTIVTVTVEEGDEVHFHAGGQGFWIARLLGRLGVPTVLCTTAGGESGRVARALIDAEPMEARVIETTTPSGSWVHDRRGGERVTVAERAAAQLDRHAADELYGATLATALGAGVCVLTGPQQPHEISSGMYRRLTSDLQANRVTTIADLSGDCLVDALDGGVDFCKTSDEDLAATDGFASDADPVRLVQALTDMGAAHAALTRGSEPLLASVDGIMYRVTAPKLTPIDHRGAGDAFTALVAAGMHWGLEWTDTVRWGAAAGALTVTRRGLATAGRREIHQLLGRVNLEELESCPRR